MARDGSSSKLKELEVSFLQQKEAPKQLQLFREFYCSDENDIHGSSPHERTLLKLNETHMQNGLEKLFNYVVGLLKCFRADINELHRLARIRAGPPGPRPLSQGSYLFKFGQQTQFWRDCMRILLVIQHYTPPLQCNTPTLHHYHLGPSIALRLICSLLHEFVAPSLRRCVKNKRESLLAYKESPEDAALCIGVNLRELARALRFHLLLFSSHYGGCSSKDQRKLFTSQTAGGLRTAWEMGLRMAGRVADIRRMQQQHGRQAKRDFQLQGGEGIDVEALGWWHPLLDAAAWTAYVLLSRSKMGVLTDGKAGEMLEIAIATMQFKFHEPCGPRLPPGVAAACVAVAALSGSKPAMQPKHFLVHGGTLASGLRIHLNQCIADIRIALEMSAAPSTAAAVAPAAATVAPSIAIAAAPPAAAAPPQLPPNLQLIHQAAALLEAACKFSTNFVKVVIMREYGPSGCLSGGSFKEDKESNVMESYARVNWGMLQETMVELMLLLDAHPTTLRTQVPHPLRLLLAQLEALVHSTVFVLIHGQDCGISSPEVSKYCETTSAIAFYNDPLRLAMRAINSCQHLLGPGAQPLSQCLPPRLEYVTAVLSLFTDLHIGLLWYSQVLLGRPMHACASSPALWAEAREFVISFIRVTAPNETPVHQEQQLQADKQEEGYYEFSCAAAIAWASSSLASAFSSFSTLLPGSDVHPCGTKDELKRIAEGLSLEPGAEDCLRILILVLTRKKLRSRMHPSVGNRLLRVMEYFFTDELSELYASASCALVEPALPSISKLLHVIDCPFDRACNQTAHSLATASASERIEANSTSVQTPLVSSLPQLSKAQRMGLLLSAQQSCMPLAMPLFSAIREETGVDPVQCCNLDCKGSKQSHVVLCPHCFGMAWCLGCVESPSCRVHCTKCSHSGT